MRGRQLGDAPRIDDVAERGVAGFEQRGRGADGHFLDRAADFERDLELQPIGDADVDRFAHPFLESRELDGDLVGAGNAGRGSGKIHPRSSRRKCPCPSRCWSRSPTRRARDSCWRRRPFRRSCLARSCAAAESGSAARRTMAIKRATVACVVCMDHLFLNRACFCGPHSYAAGAFYQGRVGAAQKFQIAKPKWLDQFVGKRCR